jgi:hypothetical protein
VAIVRAIPNETVANKVGRSFIMPDFGSNRESRSSENRGPAEEET